MTDWLLPFLSVMPWMAWFFFGVGIPYALWLLPRQDWQDWPLVTATALAFGPLVGTTWLFFLGSFWGFTLVRAFLGTLILAGVAGFFAWRRRNSVPLTTTPPYLPASIHWPMLNGVLVVLMAIAVLAMSWDTAFWPFLRYDTLWTFGYNAKIFMLHSHIPTSIDYYPNLVPLSFTFGDLAWGEHNDHAARAAVPWFFLATIFATYAFAGRAFRSRQIGLYTAALWTLLPSSLVWSSSGDLEHPMVIYFTLAACFFILAWREIGASGFTATTKRYGLLCGLMLGGAMWTKPTSGAFVIGVVLVLAASFIHAYRFKHWEMWWVRFKLVALVGLSAAPIGTMWYGRNILLGHRWTNLPPRYWQDLAQRSGMQLVWVYAILALVGVYLVLWHGKGKRWRFAGLGILALVVLSLAILPTLISLPDRGWTQDTTWDWLNGFREPHRRLNTLEFALISLGSAFLLWIGRPRWAEMETGNQQAIWLTVGLGGPFFAVYFWSFSYHYRLALTVLPLMLALFMAVVVHGLAPVLAKNRLRRIGVVLVVLVWGMIAPFAATYHTWLNTFKDDGVRTDREKYAYANPALMMTVGFLEAHAAAENQASYRVLAPGENRLAFFFPTWQIDDETLPLDVDDLGENELFVQVFAGFLWQTYNLIPNQVQAWTQLAHAYPQIENGILPADGPFGQIWPKVLIPISPPFDDGNNRYVIYGVDVSAAYADIPPERPLTNVVFGETMQLMGFDISSEVLQRGQPFTLNLYWRGTENGPPLADYSIYVHFIDPQTGELVHQRDGGLMGGLFPTRILTPGMVLQDRREWVIPTELPPGPVILRVGVYDSANQRLPVTLDGVMAGDGVVIHEALRIE